MLKYRHILLATDLSGASDQVAQRARELADAANAKLSVVHVIENSPVAYGGEFSIPIDVNLQQTLEAQAMQGLAELGKKYHIDPDHQHIGSGSVKLAVVDLAHDLNADLIVVGTHGHHGIAILLGSRANAILHNAKCDVWVVKIAE